MEILYILLPLNLIVIGAIAWGLTIRYKRALSTVQVRLQTLGKNVSEPLMKALSKFAQGDLSVQIAPISNSTNRPLKGSFKALEEQLNRLEGTQTQAAEEFNNLTSTVSKRLCFIGGDAYSQGRQCGELMGSWLREGGKVLISTGHLNSTGQMLRRKGFGSVLEDKFPRISIDTVLENHEKTELAYQQTLDYLSSNPGIKGIYVTEGATPYMVARAVKEAGLSGKVSIVCQDLSEETITCIMNGSIRATLADSTFAQGHDPVIHLFNHLAANWHPAAPRMTIDADIVTAENWKEFWQQGEGPVTSPEFLSRLPKPLSGGKIRPFHITVIGCENSPYWYPIRDGVLRAARELEHYGTQVQWVVKKGLDLTTEVVAPLLQEALGSGADAVALIAEEPSIIPHINDLVGKGIPVVTYITEPSSLRAFITTVTDQSRRLLNLNQGVLESAAIVEKANDHLQNSLQASVGQAEEQARKSQASQEAMSYLTDELNMLNSQAIESFKGSENTMKAVEDGNQTIQSTFSSIKVLDETFKHTYQLIETLSMSTEQINASIEAIKAVASQVNVLAFNAAVEAARAGTAGAGFKVLSEEIRKLSDQASSGTNQITKQIATIRQGVQSTHELMGNGVKSLKETSDLAMLADATFANIKEQSLAERARSGQVAEHLASMVKKSQTVLNELAHMAEDSTRNAETLKTIEKDGQTLQEQFERVSSGARELEAMAAVEQTLLARFIQ